MLSCGYYWFKIRRGYPYVKRIPSCKFYLYVNTLSMRNYNILIIIFKLTFFEINFTHE